MLYTDLGRKAVLGVGKTAEEFEQWAKGPPPPPPPPYLILTHQEHLEKVEEWFGHVTLIEQFGDLVILRQLPEANATKE